MPRTVRCALIQASNAISTERPLAQIRKAMIDKHLKLIEQAARKKTQILCLQELFYGPYFCAEQNARWYELTERVPDGPTVRMMQKTGRQTSHGDRGSGLRGADARRLFQHRRGDRRRRPLSRQISQASHPALPSGILGKILFHSWRSGISRVRDKVCTRRRLHLLRPPLSGGRPHSGIERGRDRFQSFSHSRWVSPNICGNSSSPRTP